MKYFFLIEPFHNNKRNESPQSCCLRPTSSLHLLNHLRSPALPKPVIRPRPVLQERWVNAILKRLIPGLELCIPQTFPGRRTLVRKSRNPIDGVDRQTESVGLVPDRQFQGGINVAFFFVSSHVQILVSRSLVRQAVDEPWVRVEIEYYGSVVCEQGDPFGIAEAVRVVDVGDELEEIDDVHAANFQVGEVLQEQVDSGQ